MRIFRQVVSVACGRIRGTAAAAGYTDMTLECGHVERVEGTMDAKGIADHHSKRRCKPCEESDG